MNELEKEYGISKLEAVAFLKDYFLRKEAEGSASGIRMEAIQNALAEKGFHSSINSVYTYLHLLDSVFGMKVVYHQRKGYEFQSDKILTEADLRLVVDSIQASSFITQPKANSLTEIITKLSGSELKKTLGRKAFNADRIHSMNDSVMASADRFYDAIANNKKISFRYFHRTFDKDNPRKYSKGNDFYTVSPYNMYWADGNYYLYAYVDEKKKFMVFRVDRMDNISLPLIDKRGGRMEYDAKAITDRKAVVFGGYISKDEVVVSFRCQNKMAEYVLERFGDKIIVKPDGEKYFTFSALINLSTPFYAWVATFGHSIKITGPEKAITGMKKFLQNASDMYEDE